MISPEIPFNIAVTDGIESTIFTHLSNCKIIITKSDEDNV